MGKQGPPVAALEKRHVESGEFTVVFALGFPSKKSAEIAPNHRKLSYGVSDLNKECNARTASILLFVSINAIFTMLLKWWEYIPPPGTIYPFI